MLDCYSARLNTVELSNPPDRSWRGSLLMQWAQQVPERFLFSVRAPTALTESLEPGAAPHLREEARKGFWESVSALGHRLGPVHFRVPASARMDLDRLAMFLDVQPENQRIVFDFQHSSWRGEDLGTLLQAYNATCVLKDRDLERGPDQGRDCETSSDFGYVCLREKSYREEQLLAWIERIAAQPWARAFVYFQSPAAGPKTAKRFCTLWDNLISGQNLETPTMADIVPHHELASSPISQAKIAP